MFLHVLYPFGMILHIVSGRGRGRTYVLQFHILFEVLSLFAVFILVKMKFFPIHFNPPMFEQTEGIEPSLTLRGGRASTALHLHFVSDSGFEPDPFLLCPQQLQ